MARDNNRAFRNPGKVVEDLAKATESLRVHNIEAEARDDVKWKISLEALRLRTEEQKSLNDAYAAKKRKA